MTSEAVQATKRGELNGYCLQDRETAMRVRYQADRTRER